MISEYTGRKKELRYKKITNFKRNQPVQASCYLYFFKKLFLQSISCFAIFAIFYYLNSYNDPKVDFAKNIVKSSIKYNVDFKRIPEKVSEIRLFLTPEKLDSSDKDFENLKDSQL